MTIEPAVYVREAGSTVFRVFDRGNISGRVVEVFIPFLSLSVEDVNDQEKDD